MKREMNRTALMIAALAGSSVGAQAIDWNSPVNGNWNEPLNWVGANVPNLVGEDAVLGLVGGYTVDMTNSFSIGALSLTNPAAKLSMAQSLTLTLDGNLVNEGLVFVNEPGSGFDTIFRFNSDATMSGAGSVRLGAIGNPGDAQLISNTGFTLTNASGHTIYGSGHLGGAFINNGSIIADDAVGAGLRIAGTLSQSAGGNVGADAGLLLLGNGSVISGGTLSTINGGEIRVENGVATIGDIVNSGVVNIPGQGYTLALNGGLTNTGVITINSNANGFNAHLRFDTTSTLSGAGTVTMFAASSNDAQLLTGAAVVGTIGAGQLVQGSGEINGASGGTIENLGTINANDATPLRLYGNHIGNGVYRSDDGILGLVNGLVLDGGTFDSSGVGLVDMVTTGVATLSNVTNLGQMGISGNGGSITLVGPMTNDGTLTINSNNSGFNAHLQFGADTAITGSGLIRMVSVGNSNDAQVFTNGVFNGTIGAGQVVAGSGIIDGRSGGTIINNGIINGDHAIDGKTPARLLELRGNMDGSGGGVFRSDDGILGLVNGLVLDGGTFDSSGVGIVDMVTTGVATLSNVTNLGQMGIRGSGGSITLVGPMINDGTLTINSNNSGFNAHLRFGADTAITGSGLIRMVTVGNLNDAQLFTDGVFVGTIGANQTVAGSGLVDGRSLGVIVNNGTINGDDPIELRLQGNHDGSGGGVYRSDGDGLLGLSGGLVMNGGTFETTGNGIVDMTTSGTAMLANITNEGTFGIRGQGGVIGLDGPLTNNGTILINSNNNGFNAHIRFFGATEINGTGTINMELAGNFNDAQILNDQGFVGTIGSGQTITGSGLIVGEMNMNGTFDPGSDERRFDIDATNLSATSGFVADLGGLLAGEFDRLTLGNNTIDLDGTLTVNLDNGYSPAFGDSWDIISGGTINGIFASTVMPSALPGQVYRVIYSPDRVQVVLTCDADLNGDQFIDFLDISMFLNFYNAQDSRSDFNEDGFFDFLDISIFLQLLSGSC